MSTSIAHNPGREVPAAGSTPLLRLRVWLHRGSLDRMLVEGAEPESSAELRCRAAQLCSARRRRALAAGIKRVVEAAEEPVNPMTAAAPLRRQEILAARADLGEIAELLQTHERVQVRGMALTERLLSDADSPLYRASPEDTLALTVRKIRAALLLR